MQREADPAMNGSCSDETMALAREKFHRVLGSWASDLLELRRLGLDRPGFRPLATASNDDRPHPTTPEKDLP